MGDVSDEEAPSIRRSDRKRSGPRSKWAESSKDMQYGDSALRAIGEGANNWNRLTPQQATRASAIRARREAPPDSGPLWDQALEDYYDSIGGRRPGPSLWQQYNVTTPPITRADLDVVRGDRRKYLALLRRAPENLQLEERVRPHFKFRQLVEAADIHRSEDEEEQMRRERDAIDALVEASDWSRK